MMNLNYANRYTDYLELYSMSPEYANLSAKCRDFITTLKEIDDVYRYLYIEQTNDKIEMDKLRDEHREFTRQYVQAIKDMEKKMDEIITDYPEDDEVPNAIPIAVATLIADIDSDDEDDDKPIALLIKEAKQENKPISKLIKEAKQENKPISTRIEKAKKNKQKKDTVTSIVNLINRSIKQTAKTGKSTTVVL